MKRKLTINIVMLTVLAVGCGTSDKDISKYNVNESISVETNEDVQEDKINIVDIFPDTIGFGWIYSGTLDYGRTEEITDCYMEDNIKHIIVEGEEDDLSDGENQKDFTFTKDYQITSDGIILKHTGSPEYLDNKQYYLLKSPLEVGNSWEHEWYYGEKAITEIIEVTHNNIVSETEIIGEYSEENCYYMKVKTTYENGKGITLVEKYCKEDFPITENLYKSGLNYLEELTNN